MRCTYSGRGKIIKRCKKEVTYEVRTIFGIMPYCTNHANIVMKNPFAFEKTVIKEIKDK